MHDFLKIVPKQTLLKKQQNTNLKDLKIKNNIKGRENKRLHKYQTISSSFLSSFNRLSIYNNYKLNFNFSSHLNWVFIFFSLSTI
jgi:hypothetical protein